MYLVTWILYSFIADSYWARPIFCVIYYWVGAEPNPLLLLRPFIGLLYQPWMIDGDDCGVVGAMNDCKGKVKYSEKTHPSAALSTTNPTWLDLGSNPGRRGIKQDAEWCVLLARRAISCQYRELGTTRMQVKHSVALVTLISMFVNRRRVIYLKVDWVACHLCREAV
jgi:hypothetical protein